VKRFSGEGRVGAYLRVLRVGTIRAGDHIHKLYVPKHGVTVGKWFREPDLESMEALKDADAAGQIRLQQPEFRKKFEALERQLAR
jgi:MOSC domain-containing protein YiiM